MWSAKRKQPLIMHAVHMVNLVQNIKSPPKFSHILRYVVCAYCLYLKCFIPHKANQNPPLLQLKG